MNYLFGLLFFSSLTAAGQQPLQWRNVDSLFGPLPSSVHVFYTEQKIDTGSFRAYYLKADIKDRHLHFTTDTSSKRRLTPSLFYERNEKPLVVVNGTFFSFETNQNLNLVMRNGKLLAYNRQTLPGRGKDTFTYTHVFASAIGITKKRKADIAWTYTDSVKQKVWASQTVVERIKDSVGGEDRIEALHRITGKKQKWKVNTAIGGGPVLLQRGEVQITNNQEAKFSGKAIEDKHPRTAMGYTKDQQLIIMVVEGRNPNAGGVRLDQLALIMKELGCVEALNLDGGGSSCLLVNGKETIKPSDKEGQRPTPAVFIIKSLR
jgi:exopolysaccharide biosynthesis protein